MVGFEFRCPRCSSARLWRSGSGWLRHLTRLVLLYPLRCDHCQKRFWRFAWNPPPAGRRRVRLA
jgi:DNA-directed RNA polymerase subunit RPC12/RpoP